MKSPAPASPSRTTRRERSPPDALGAEAGINPRSALSTAGPPSPDGLPSPKAHSHRAGVEATSRAREHQPCLLRPQAVRPGDAMFRLALKLDRSTSTMLVVPLSPKFPPSTALRM